MGVVALGFALGGCPAESAPDDEEAEVSAEPLYGVATTGDTLDTDGATSSPATSSTTTDASESSAPGSSSDASSSGGETDTDTGSTSLEPDYGVPTTTG